MSMPIVLIEDAVFVGRLDGGGMLCVSQPLQLGPQSYGRLDGNRLEVSGLGCTYHYVGLPVHALGRTPQPLLIAYLRDGDVAAAYEVAIKS